jgi:histone acetyltransferase (RNA polymerase elongator complex component)
MNSGCPHRCIFCNENLTAGNYPSQITACAFNETIGNYLKNSDEGETVQIAFYGGTFTGMELSEQKRLLDCAAPFLQSGEVDSIRISTRPDEIDAANLDFLKLSGVATVEIGAQSFDDGVLLESHRGHTAEDSVRAMKLLRERGFTTGIHLMVGLPGDSPERFTRTIEKTIALHPDTVRIHPTIVLRDTVLARDLRDKKYKPLSLEEAIEASKEALKKFTAAGIAVIRLGLQTTKELEEPGAVVGGPFHPAFRSLVEGAIFLEMAQRLLDHAVVEKNAVNFFVSPSDVSRITGMKRKNMTALKDIFSLKKIKIISDPSQKKGTLAMEENGRRRTIDFTGHIFYTSKNVCTKTSGVISTAHNGDKSSRKGDILCSNRVSQASSADPTSGNRRF